MEKLHEETRNFDDIGSFVNFQGCGSRTVHEILAKKSPRTWTVRADASVYESLLVMAEHSVGALVVIDGERVAGLSSNGITHAR